MREVRVHHNPDEGTLWWAEDGLEFTGGADLLADLVASIHEWAEAEGLLDDLRIRLVPDERESPTKQPVKLPEPIKPLSRGTDAVRVGFSLAGAR